MTEISLPQAKHSTEIEWTHRPGTKGETWNEFPQLPGSGREARP